MDEKELKIVKQEGVFTVYKKTELIAIIKRDEISKKHLTYLVKEATSDDLADLIGVKEKISQ